MCVCAHPLRIYTAIHAMCVRVCVCVCVCVCDIMLWPSFPSFCVCLTISKGGVFSTSDSPNIAVFLFIVP